MPTVSVPNVAGRYLLKDPDSGVVRLVDKGEVTELLETGFQPATLEEYNLQGERAKYDRPGAAFGTGLIRGASMGLLDLAAREMEAKGGAPLATELRKERQYNPWASLGGELVGAAGTAFVPTSPAGLLGRGAAAVGEKAALGVGAKLEGRFLAQQTERALLRPLTPEVGERAAALAAGQTGLGKLTRHLVTGIVEGGGYGGAAAASELALTEKDTGAGEIAKTLASHLSHGAVLGGALGMGVGALRAGVSKVAGRFSKPRKLVQEQADAAKEIEAIRKPLEEEAQQLEAKLATEAPLREQVKAAYDQARATARADVANPLARRLGEVEDDLARAQGARQAASDTKAQLEAAQQQLVAAQKAAALHVADVQATTSRKLTELEAARLAQMEELAAGLPDELTRANEAAAYSAARRAARKGDPKAAELEALEAQLEAARGSRGRAAEIDAELAASKQLRDAHQQAMAEATAPIPVGRRSAMTPEQRLRMQEQARDAAEEMYASLSKPPPDVEARVAALEKAQGIKTIIEKSSGRPKILQNRIAQIARERFLKEEDYAKFLEGLPNKGNARSAQLLQRLEEKLGTGKYGEEGLRAAQAELALYTEFGGGRKAATTFAEHLAEARALPRRAPPDPGELERLTGAAMKLEAEKAALQAQAPAHFDDVALARLEAARKKLVAEVDAARGAAGKLSESDARLRGWRDLQDRVKSLGSPGEEELLLKKQLAELPAASRKELADLEGQISRFTRDYERALRKAPDDARLAKIERRRDRILAQMGLREQYTRAESQLKRWASMEQEVAKLRAKTTRENELSQRIIEIGEELGKRDRGALSKLAQTYAKLAVGRVTRQGVGKVTGQSVNATQFGTGGSPAASAVAQVAGQIFAPKVLRALDGITGGSATGNLAAGGLRLGLLGGELAAKATRAIARATEPGGRAAIMKGYASDDWDTVNAQLQLTPDQVAQQTASALADQPAEIVDVVAAQRAQAQAFLQSKMPRDPLEQAKPVYIPTRKWEPSPQQMATFQRYTRAVEGGPEGFARAVAEGRVTRQDVEAMAAVWPEFLAALQSTLKAQVERNRARGKYPTAANVKQLDIVLQQDGPALNPALAIYQAVFAAQGRRQQPTRGMGAAGKVSAMSALPPMGQGGGKL